MSSYPKVWLLRLLCCTLLWMGCMAVKAQTSSANDEMLLVLQHSMKQHFDSLQHTNYPVYFMAYRVNETTEHQTSANFGYIYDNSSSKSVILTIEIRVGSPQTDNFHYLSRQTNQKVRQTALPLDGDTVLIKKIITRETDRTYHEAVLQFVENQANEKIFHQDDDETYAYLTYDFDQYYDPPILDYHWDEDNIAHFLRHCTKDVTLSPEFTEISANLVFRTTRKYLVNSENRNIVENHCSTTLTLKTEGLSSKSTLEHIEHQHFANLPEQLPDADVLQKEMQDMEIRLSNILPASDYCSDGVMDYELANVPVLLSENAASVLAHHLFGHEAEKVQSDLMKGEVIPEAFSVFCDPTITKYNGHILGGSYQFDDEGTNSQRITLIEKGMLEQRPSTRTQKPGSSYSNGHARGNLQMPSPRQSNIIVTSSNPQNDNLLKEQLLAEARQQKKEFGLYVEEADIHCDTTSGIITICPTVCFKVYVHNLLEEDARDIVISGSTQQWFNNLIAGGSTSGSVSIVCHNMNDEMVTHSCAPALLFRQAEVRPETKATAKHIVNQIVAPISDAKENVSELFFQTAQEEWATDIKEMMVGDINGPYYLDYLMTDARIFAIEASEGSLFYSNEKQVRKLTPKVLLGGDLSNNDNLYQGSDVLPKSYKMSIDDRNGALVRDFRKATEAEYLKAITQWEIKKTTSQQTDNKAVRERSSARQSQFFNEQNLNVLTLNELEHFARETSTALANHDFLNHSGANIFVMMGNAYYWNSEKTRYVRPISVIGMQIYGAVQKDGGEEFLDGKTIFFPYTDSLFFSKSVQNEIDMLVAHLQNVKRSGKNVTDCYSGPILIEGEAVGQFLTSTLLEGKPNLLAQRESVLSSEATDRNRLQSFENQLDKIITSKKISVTANKFGDVFDKAAFTRHEKTDAEGVETMETEIIRDGELIALMGNRNVTKSTPFSNGFQQLAIHNEGCFSTQGGNRIDFEHKTTVSHTKLKQVLIKEAKKQGFQYAYILRQAYDHTLQNIFADQSYNITLLQLYRVDVRTGKEVPVTGATIGRFNFSMLNNILAVSNRKAAFPVMMKVNGASGSRDFPFAGVPTCIVAPDGILLNRVFIAQ